MMLGGVLAAALKRPCSGSPARITLLALIMVGMILACYGGIEGFRFTSDLRSGAMEVRDGRQLATDQDPVLCQVDKGYLVVLPEILLLGGLLVFLRRTVRLWPGNARLVFIGLRLRLRATVYRKRSRLSVVLLVLRL